MKSFPLLLVLLTAVASVPMHAAEVTIFAAASLTNALRAIAPGCQKSTGHSLRFNFGASGTLAQQIKAGAPADLFFLRGPVARRPT